MYCWIFFVCFYQKMSIRFTAQIEYMFFQEPKEEEALFSQVISTK